MDQIIQELYHAKQQHKREYDVVPVPGGIEPKLVTIDLENEMHIQKLEYKLQTEIELKCTHNHEPEKARLIIPVTRIPKLDDMERGVLISSTDYALLFKLVPNLEIRIGSDYYDDCIFIVGRIKSLVDKIKCSSRSRCQFITYPKQSTWGYIHIF